jgi:protein TIF31
MDTSSEHVADIARTQECFLLSGADNTDSTRDWNEEFQSTRELSKELVQERVFRERLTSRLFADFTEAAARGAVLVARGEIAPLNPTEPKGARIFVYNNVFFSFGADGVGTFASEGGDEAARAATGKDVNGIRQVNQLDIEGLYTPGTVIVDYLGRRIVGQSIVPGIFRQREPGQHQIDYGGVDEKDVITCNEQFVGVFEQLSKALHVKKHPVWDKEGKRYDLEGSLETKGLLGTDGRKYVLDLYRLTPLDVKWLEQYWSDDVDGAVKPKEKDYPHKMAMLRPELVESYYRLKLREFVNAELAKRLTASSNSEANVTVDGDANGKVSGETDGEANGSVNGKADGEPNSEANGEANGVSKSDPTSQAAKHTKEPEDDEDVKDDSGQEQVDLSGFEFSLNPDVFTGQVPQTEEEMKEWASDEVQVRAVCDHLVQEVIPRFINDIKEAETAFPMDSRSMSTFLHRRGINLRYLGVVASLADEEDPRLQAFKRLAVHEMILRSFKHVANHALKNTSAIFAPACTSHLLNCFLGTGLNMKPNAEVDESLKHLFPDDEFQFESMTPELLRSEVEKQVHQRFRYSLDGMWIECGKEMQMLREVALALGLQLEAKDYIFHKEHNIPHSDASSAGSDTPVVNGHLASSSKKKKKNKKGGNARSRSRTPQMPPRQAVTFTPDNILNFLPVIKEGSPRSMLADEAMEAGRISIVQGQRDLGRDLLLESHSLYEQVYGVLHPEVALAYYQLSTLFYNLDDKDAAVDLARKAVIVSERTLGVDSSDTILSYLNLGLLEHSSGNHMVALAYIRHALELGKIVYGPKHPDAITTINNAAVMLQSIRQYHMSRQWFEASLSICEEVSGKQSINTATMLFQLSQALALDRDMRGAVNRMRESFNIFNALLGPKHRNTLEAENWLEQLTQNAVMVAKQAKDLENKRLRRLQFTPRFTMAAKPQPGPVGQPRPTTAASAALGATRDGLDSRSIDELLKYIEGDTTKKPTKKKTTNPKRRGQRVQAAQVTAS